MRVVKYFCYEVPFLKREEYLITELGDGSHPSALSGIFEIRTNELRGISKIQNFSSAKCVFSDSIKR